MLRRTSFILLSAFVVLILGSIVSSAQNAPVTGRVEMKKGDAVVPVEGALVEVFRTDIKSSGPADKTDKKGQFSFAGLQLGGVFVLSVSAPGAQPTYLPNVKAGNENLKITLSEGDGRRLTPDEVRTALTQTATSPGGKTELTADEKKAQAEQEAKIKEVTEKNKKIEQENVIITKSLEEGNAAFNAKNFDLAITKYSEGVAANPDFAGSAPVLLNNKGAALRERAVINYNKNVKNTDTTSKLEAFRSVKADFAEAADAYNKSWAILKNAQSGDITNPQIKDQQIATALLGAKDTFRLMAKTDQVEPNKLDIAKAMIPEYIAAEPDVIKKGEAQTVLGDVFRVGGDFDRAIAEYRKAIEISKDSPDALAGLGLSLVNVGIIAKDEGDSKKDKAMSEMGTAKMQEGLNFLGLFTQVAPDTHPLKASVKETTEYLSTQAKLAPQKVTTPKKRN